MRMMRCLAAILAGAVSLASTVAASQPAPPAADEFRVTLLGTGSPNPVMRRFGPGVLVPAVTEADVVALTRKTYAGPLVVGEDLMAFRIEAERVVQLPGK